MAYIRYDVNTFVSLLTHLFGMAKVLATVVFCAALHLAERWVRTAAVPRRDAGGRLRPLELIEAAAVGVALAAVVAVGLADKDPQQFGFVGEFHATGSLV